MKFLKVGRVAIITRGRYAGKKVVLIQPVDSGTKTHPFSYALVAGIERYPSKVTRRMVRYTLLPEADWSLTLHVGQKAS